MAVLGRAIGTYRALIILLERGCTEQVWMLNRSLFEDMVTGYWLALPVNRDQATRLFSAHLGETDERIDVLLKRLRECGFSAFQEADSKLWKGRSALTKTGLDKMVDEIAGLWAEQGGSVDELRAHQQVTQWRSNLALHVSGVSIEDAMLRGSVKVGSKRVFMYGQTRAPDEEHMLLGFSASFFRLGSLARLVLTETDRPFDELERTYKDAVEACKTLGPSERRRRIQVNDPCWCRSGEKLKRCHGRF